MAVLWEHPWFPQRLFRTTGHQVPISTVLQLTQHALAVAGDRCISLFSVTCDFFACFAEDTTASVWILYEKGNVILK